MAKIAMLCSSHPVDDARVTQKQAVSLAKAGHEVVVYGQEPIKVGLVPGVTLRAIGPRICSIPKRFVMMFKLYRAAKLSNPDILVCHEPESALVGVFMKYRFGMKVVFDLHEFFHETISSRMPAFISKVVRKMSKALLKFLVRKSDWVTVVSPNMKDLIEEIRGDSNVSIVRNSPVLDYFPISQDNTSKECTVAHEGFLCQQRGLVEMLEAIAIVRETRQVSFLVIGKVRPEDEQLFDSKIKQLDLSEVVNMSGWKPWTEIGQIESQAQIGLVCLQNTPNNFWGLGNKLYNYMSCGLAVIGPEGSATAELIKEYNCGLCVDTSNPDEIAEAIVKLCSNAEMRRQMGANGRKAIEDELGWHKMEEVLLRIYSQL